MTTSTENRGPAETIIQTLLTYTDHAYHGRPGYVVPCSDHVGVKWAPVTTKTENGETTVYELRKVGKKSTQIRLGVKNETNQIKNSLGRVIGEFRPSGLFPEVVAWMYQQVAEVYKLDSEYVAHWGSYAFAQDHKDLKVILAAFLLCQDRKGDPIKENGEVLFHDEDYRDIGEAMCLIYRKDKKDLDPKMLMRIHDVLCLPQVAEINRKLKFGKSNRKPFLGRWTKAVHKWLQYREENPKMLEALVKAGWKSTVKDLCRVSGYKPTSAKFFEILRWKQKQAKEGHRTLALDMVLSKAEDWSTLTEEQICEKIMADRPNFKRIVGMLPNGLTAAILAASVEVKSLSDKDLIVYAPTLEEYGLLAIPEINARWKKALDDSAKSSQDMRAVNVAQRMKTQAAKEALEKAADDALKNAVKEAVKGIDLFVVVDISGSMDGAIEQAVEYLSKFVQAIPLDQIRVSVFNVTGRAIKIPHASGVGVKNAFRGIKAGGGTFYSQGIKAAAQGYQASPDRDLVMIFVGDEEDSHSHFVNTINDLGLKPTAFGLIRVLGKISHGGGMVVRTTASMLRIPCFIISQETFNDVYSIPRIIQNLIKSFPPNQDYYLNNNLKRTSLIDDILKTDLLIKPIWAT